MKVIHDGRRMNVTIGARCTRCDKIIRTEAQARKQALIVRVGGGHRRLSARRHGWDRTVAYECPHGYGWHIGRAKKPKPPHVTRRERKLARLREAAARAGSANASGKPEQEG